MKTSILLFLLLMIAAISRAEGRQDSLQLSACRSSLRYLDNGFVFSCQETDQSGESSRKLIPATWLLLRIDENGFMSPVKADGSTPECKMELLGVFAPESLSIVQNETGKVQIFIGPYLQASIPTAFCNCLEIELTQVDSAPAIEIWVPRACKSTISSSFLSAN